MSVHRGDSNLLIVVRNDKHHIADEVVVNRLML